MVASQGDDAGRARTGDEKIDHAFGIGAAIDVVADIDLQRPIAGAALGDVAVDEVMRPPEAVRASVDVADRVENHPLRDGRIANFASAEGLKPREYGVAGRRENHRDAGEKANWRAGSRPSPKRGVVALRRRKAVQPLSRVSPLNPIEWRAAPTGFPLAMSLHTCCGLMIHNATITCILEWGRSWK